GLPGTELGRMGLVLVRASGLGILALVAVTTISVFKPWGRTRYGQRKHEERYPTGQSPRTIGRSPTSDRSEEPSLAVGRARQPLPRGLKMFLAAGIGLLVLVKLVTMHLTGHGHLH